MNILLIVFVALILWRGWRGMKIGLVDEAGRLLSLVITLFVLSLAILLYTSVKANNTKNIVLSAAMILVTGLAARLIRMVVKSLSAIAHLPVISVLNGLLGIVIGIAEVVVILWILYVVIANFDLGEFGLQITNWTKQSEILQKLYDMNQIAYWMAAGL